jgi:predicted  nucleic acid-binding Zn-ribbon protein
MANRVTVIDRVSSLPDSLLFMCAFVIGGLGIIIFRGVFGFSAFHAVVFSFSIMMSYFCVIKLSPTYRQREDRAGDNLYFLGFIFTVMSLGIALFRYQSDTEINQIMGDLGVGLSTTVFGLVFRIILTNQRKDPDEIEEITRLELSEAVDRTTAQLNATTRVIEAVQSQGRQIMEEAQESINTANASVLESLRQLDTKLQAIQVPDDMITSKVDPMLINLGSSIDRLVQRLDAIQVQPDLLDQKASELFAPLNIMVMELRDKLNQIDLSSLVAKLDTSVDGLIVKLGSIDIPSDVIANKASSAFDPLDQAVVELRDKLRSLEVSPDFLSDQISPLIQDISTLQNSLRDQQQRYAETVESAFQNIAGHQNDLTQFSESSTSLLDNQERLLNWANSITANENQLNQLNQTLTGVLNALSNTTDQITQSSSNTLAQQEAYRDAFTEIATEIDSTKRSISELSGTIQNIGTQFAKVIREITELAEDRTR